MTSFNEKTMPLKQLLESIAAGEIHSHDVLSCNSTSADALTALIAHLANGLPIEPVSINNPFSSEYESFMHDALPKEIIEALGFDEQTSFFSKTVLPPRPELSSLAVALSSDKPVTVQMPNGELVKRHYYFDIEKALKTPNKLHKAIFSVDVSRIIKSQFLRKTKLDLSTREKECQQLCFPCNMIFTPYDWDKDLQRFARQQLTTFKQFNQTVLSHIRDYQVPMRELNDNHNNADVKTREYTNENGQKVRVTTTKKHTFRTVGSADDDNNPLMGPMKDLFNEDYLKKFFKEK